MPIVILAICVAQSHAWADIEQTDLFEIKAKLEQATTKKFHDRISTRLSSELFSVGAQIDMSVKKEMVEVAIPDAIAKQALGHSQTSNGIGDLPTDVSLGIFLAHNQPEKKEAETGPTITKVMKDRIKINRVTVHVGLSPKLGATYRSQFKVWLDGNIKSEFGPIGAASVYDFVELPKEDPEKEKAKEREREKEREHDRQRLESMPKKFELKMEPKAIEITMPEPTKPRPLTNEEKFGQYQNAIGMGIIAVILMVTLLIGKFIPSRDVREQVAAAERLEAARSQNSSSGGGSPAPKEASVAALTGPSGPTGGGGGGLSLSYEAFQEQQRKVAFLVMSSKDSMFQITQFWMDDGEVGRTKLALVIDCVLAHLGNQTGPNRPELQLDWATPDNVRTDKDLSKVFRSIASMNLETKFTMLDRAYWDLLSIKTLGEGLTKQRFAGVSHLPPAQIMRLMQEQDERVKSVTFLHLPSEKLKQVVSLMPIEGKHSLLTQAFSNGSLTEADLDMVDGSLNTMIRRERMENVNAVDLPRLVPGLLSAFTPLEEIQVVRQFLGEHPQVTDYLKQNYPCLCFLPEWPKEKLRLVLTKAKPPEILALLNAMPEYKTQILGVLPPRTQQMLADDSRKLKPEEMNNQLALIRNRIKTMFDNHEIDLTQFFATAQDPNSGMAA